MSEHVIEITVRDSECDMQGVVNNARYLYYLEHARHCLLREYGIEFSQLTAREIFPVVTHMDIHYQESATSGNTLLVKTSLEKKGLVRIIFHQQIINAENKQMLIKAQVTAAVLAGEKKVPMQIKNSSFSALFNQETSQTS